MFLSKHLGHSRKTLTLLKLGTFYGLLVMLTRSKFDLTK